MNTEDNAATSDKIPVSLLIIKLLLFLAISAAAVLFCISLVLEISFEYKIPTLPESMSADETLYPISSTDESVLTPTEIHTPIFYCFSEAVPESDAVEYDYFDDTVFIGDSRIKGLINNTKLSPYDFSSVGLNISSIRTKAYIRLPDESGELASYTLIDALTREDISYKSIYIATGLNELGWPVNGYINTLTELIKEIREVTDVPIYMQLILPVTTKSSETSPYGITNEQCFIFNERLILIAEEFELFLLDPRGLFTLEDGTLDPAHSSDGIHLNYKSCAILADYYRTHTVDINEYDNTRPDTAEDIGEGDKGDTDENADGQTSS